MSTENTAYRSSAPAVLDSWQAFQDATAANRDARDAVSARFGRGLMVNRSGFGHGTRVVGFEVLESDKPGDVIGDDGELYVPRGGWQAGTVVPNRRRKAGKDLDAELVRLASPRFDLLGMPAWTLVGARSLAPDVLLHDGALWVEWGGDIEPAASLDLTLWERAKLSELYAAREADAAKHTEAAEAAKHTDDEDTAR